jgi:hypothetical protein
MFASKQSDERSATRVLDVKKRMKRKSKAMPAQRNEIKHNRALSMSKANEGKE